MSTIIAKKNKPLSKKHAFRASQLLQECWLLLQAGQIQESEKSCLSILNKYPNYPEALLLLGIIANRVGNIDLAITRFHQAIIIKPNLADAYYNLGNAHQTLGHIEEAIQCFNKTITLKPDFASAHNNLGIIFIGLERLEEAVTHFKRALTLKPDYALAHNNIGNALKDLGQVADAKFHFEQALSFKPDYADAHSNLGTLCQDMGHKEEAISHYEQALIIQPNFSGAHYNLTKIKPEQEQVPKLEGLLSSPAVSDEDAMNYHFALGNIFNFDKSYSKSFEHFIKGNTLKRKTINYDSHKHTDFIDSLIETYSENYFKEKTIIGSDSDLPVFILGMPRSGTTLVEQIVSSHPQVFGADELSTLGRIEGAIGQKYESSNPYPQCMSLFDDSSACELASEYLHELRGYSQEATRITDKAPYNFLRIGLIKLLFPKARIIHCQRNVLDTCTSIFLNNFTSGNEFSYDLREIGQFYLDYERLMKHWHTLFPSEIFDIQYEALISNQEETSHQLIDYLGLEWDEHCLAFHNNNRAVRTASNLQVRQPIYTKSVERWRRYEEHLKPLITIVQQ
jgi:tetratricopeptide (TPR) repeat protein